jgi:hypothetical protein
MPLADQFLNAARAARAPSRLDELARKLWRAHAEGQLDEADAQAISEAVEARRAVLATGGRPKAALGLPRASRRREKVFGLGRPRPLDCNAKVRIMGALQRRPARSIGLRGEAGARGDGRCRR